MLYVLDFLCFFFCVSKKNSFFKEFLSTIFTLVRISNNPTQVLFFCSTVLYITKGRTKSWWGGTFFFFLFSLHSFFLSFVPIVLFILSYLLFLFSSSEGTYCIPLQCFSSFFYFVDSVR